MLDHLSIPSCPVKQLTLIQKILLKPLLFVIVVEKETVFQRILSLEWFQKISNATLLITACGYPDFASRDFVHQLLASL